MFEEVRARVDVGGAEFLGLRPLGSGEVRGLLWLGAEDDVFVDDGL